MVSLISPFKLEQDKSNLLQNTLNLKYVKYYYHPDFFQVPTRQSLIMSLSKRCRDARIDGDLLYLQSDCQERDISEIFTIEG